MICTEKAARSPHAAHPLTQPTDLPLPYLETRTWEGSVSLCLRKQVTHTVGKNQTREAMEGAYQEVRWEEMLG